MHCIKIVRKIYQHVVLLFMVILTNLGQCNTTYSTETANTQSQQSKWKAITKGVIGAGITGYIGYRLWDYYRKDGTKNLSEAIWKGSDKGFAHWIKKTDAGNINEELRYCTDPYYRIRYLPYYPPTRLETPLQTALQHIKDPKKQVIVVRQLLKLGSNHTLISPKNLNSAIIKNPDIADAFLEEGRLAPNSLLLPQAFQNPSVLSHFLKAGLNPNKIDNCTINYVIQNSDSLPLLLHYGLDPNSINNIYTLNNEFAKRGDHFVHQLFNYGLHPNNLPGTWLLKQTPEALAEYIDKEDKPLIPTLAYVNLAPDMECPGLNKNTQSGIKSVDLLAACLARGKKHSAVILLRNITADRYKYLLADTSLLNEYGKQLLEAASDLVKDSTFASLGAIAPKDKNGRPVPANQVLRVEYHRKLIVSFLTETDLLNFAKAVRQARKASAKQRS